MLPMLLRSPILLVRIVVVGVGGVVELRCSVLGRGGLAC
jgi:hypothetical protein